MYGFISSNLEEKIFSYLKYKSLEVKYKKVNITKKENLNSMLEQIKKDNIKILIIDSSNFEDEKVAIDLVYNLKVSTDVRIIFISFEKELLTKLAMIGIYDLIYYNKNINFTSELDDVLIKEKKLSDINHILNLEKLYFETEEKEEVTILFNALDRKVNLTTLLLQIISSKKVERLTYVDFKRHNNINLQENFTEWDKKEYDFGTVLLEDKKEIIICNEKMDKEKILELMLYLSSKRNPIIIDASDYHLEKFEGINVMMKSVDKIYLVDTKSDIRKQTSEYKEAIVKLNPGNEKCEVIVIPHNEDYKSDEYLEEWIMKFGLKNKESKMQKSSVAEKIILKVKELNLLEYNLKNK